MKKRILFITYNLKLGGANSALYDLVKLLDKNKYEITIFTIHDGGPWEQKFRDIGIRIVNSYSQMKNGTGLVQKIRNKIKLMKIEYSRKHMGKNLIALTIGEKFDLVVLQHSYEPYELAALIPGMATVRYIHGDVQNNERFRQVLEDSAPYFNRYDKIICVSKVAEHSFNQVFGCEQITQSCFNPIDSDEIKAKSAEKIDLDLSIPYICAVGRLAPEKGIVRLVRIHSRLIKSGFQHRLVIVGDGPERAAIDATIRETDTIDSVIMVGYKDNPYPYICNSMFTVCPSYSEGLHMVSMESLSLGVPVVSSVEPVRELFGEECCGIITDNDDESLEAGIRKMLAEREFYEKTVIGAKARSAVFDSNAMIREVEQIFDEVLEGDER